MRVVVLEDHAAPVVQVAIWYRFGAAFERPGKTGLAHALEHMMFRGTPSLSAAGLDDVGARLGAQVNAQTTNEFTHYSFVMPADRLDLAIHIEADRMQHLKLDPEDWNIERGAILQEWDQDDSSPLHRLIFGLQEKVYPHSPLGKFAIGERKDIVSATVADVRRYYETWYAPNNATLVITGDADPKAAIALAERWFAPIPAKALPGTKLERPPTATGGTIEATAELPFEILDLAYALPGTAPPSEIENARSLLALAAIGNPRAPFRKALVERGLTYAYFLLPQLDRHVGLAHALFIIAPGHTAAEVRAVWEKTLTATLDAGFDPPLVEAGKRAAISFLTYARDSITGLGDSIGSGYAFPGDMDVTTAEATIRAITAEEVNAAGRTYFAKPNAVGHLNPAGTDPSAFKPPTNLGAINDNFSARTPNGPIVEAPWVTAAVAKPLDLHSVVHPTSFVLSNGMRVLVQEAHANPTVVVRGAIRSSADFDPRGKEGLTGMTASLLSYGSAKYDFEAQRSPATALPGTFR